MSLALFVALVLNTELRSYELQRSRLDWRLFPAKPLIKEEKTGTDPDHDNDSDSDVDVQDPHLDSTARKREIEDQMSEDERKALRGGWEEFFPGLGVKRSASPISGSTTKRQATKNKPAFGADMVKEETKKALGLTYTSHRQSAQTTGPWASSASHTTGNNAAIAADGSLGWACKICTFANLSDHGRCGTC